MSDRKSVLEMFGELCREAAVLTAVFIPLDFVLIDAADRRGVDTRSVDRHTRNSWRLTRHRHRM
jgi:hypothetical protein